MLVELLDAIKQVSSDLYVVEIDGLEIPFVLPPYKEVAKYYTILSLIQGNSALENVLYEHIFSTSVQDEYLAEHDDDILAGIPTTIAKLIIHLSGFTKDRIGFINETLDAYRQTADDPINIMKRRICEAFAGYKFSDIDQLSFQDMVYIYTQAEQLLIDKSIIVEQERLVVIPIDNVKDTTANIDEMIRRDLRDQQRFENSLPNQRLTDTPEYKAKVEQARKRFER